MVRLPPTKPIAQLNMPPIAATGARPTIPRLADVRPRDSSFRVIDQDNLRLTDFLDLATLQEIQDSFAAVANVKALITDASGATLTQATPTKDFISRQRAIADAEASVDDGPQKAGREYIAPIVVADQRLGTIRMVPLTPRERDAVNGIDEQKLALLADKTGLDAKAIKSLLTQLAKLSDNRPAAIQFLHMLANAIARLCYQEFQLRQRINELTAVYNVTMMLSEARDLQRVLDRTVRVVCEVMECKAASIRLIDAERDELVIKAVANLSQQYLSKGAIRLSTAEIDRVALSTKGYEYVRNMASDPRVAFPQESAREGIVSMLSVGMRYKGRAVGVLRVYTDEETVFSQLKIDLLKAVAAQAAAAIENARLLEESIESERLEQQVAMAADVQQRMLPHIAPEVPGVDLASAYVPCFELGGDFYDFIPLPEENTALVVADVSGKGVAASLIMASVRSALRAQVDNVYYLYEVMRRLNMMLCRDTQPQEFVTIFYGVLDRRNLRLTYCNAGHPPGLILRDGDIIELGSENLVLGVDPDEQYTQHLIDLKVGDTIVLYTDGLIDAMNFDSKVFGMQRLRAAVKTGGASAEAVVQNILWSVRRFVGMAKRNDDISMIIAQITDNGVLRYL